MSLKCVYCGKSADEMVEFPVADRYISSVDPLIWCNDEERELHIERMDKEAQAIEDMRAELQAYARTLQTRVAALQRERTTKFQTLRIARRETERLDKIRSPRRELEQLKVTIIANQSRQGA